MFIYTYSVVYVCICTCVGIHICVRMHVWVFSVYLYLFVCSVACFSVSDPFGELRTSYTTPGPESDSCRCGPDTIVIRRPIHG